MAITILKLPATPSPLDSLTQGFSNGVNMAQNVAKAQLLNTQNKYLPQQMQSAADLARAKMQLAQIQAQYAPQINQANINKINSYTHLNDTRASGIPMLNALRAQQIQADMALDPQKAALMQAQIDLAKARSNGVNSKMMAPQMGVQMVGVDANGKPIFSSGQGVQGAMPAQQGMTQSANGALIKSPFSPSSRFGTAGATVVNPATGQMTNVPTDATVNKAQQGLIGEESVKEVLPYVNKVVTGDQSQAGVATYLNQKMQELGRLSGINSDKLNKYQAAVTTLIPSLSESLVAAWGLNKTGELLKRTQDSLTPRSTDTPDSFRQRQADLYAYLTLRSGKWRDMLAQGIPLNNKPGQQPTMEELTDYYYKQLKDGKQAIPDFSKSAAQNQATQSQNIPQGRVKVVGADGKAYHIPADQLQAALAQGYKQG